MTAEEGMRVINTELVRATVKHGPFNGARHAHSVIEEEYDEFWDAIKADDLKHARLEVAQLGAMCLRYLMDVK